MAGLIQNTIANNQPVYGADTKDFDATTRTVNPETETVAGQLNSLLTSGSPYLERAKAGARETANSRGLLNSSIAAGAGEAAAIDAALPIATADANAYGTAARENQGYENTSDQFNAGAENTSNLQAAGAANQSLLQSQAGQIQTGLQELKGTQATTLANIEASYKDLMQTSASASSFFAQASNNINDILADPNTSVEQKQAAVNTQTNLLQSAMTVIGSIANVDLAGLLNFSGTAP